MKPRDPVQSSPAGPTGEKAVGPLELERKLDTGIGDAEIIERTEDLENNENKKDGVCG